MKKALFILAVLLLGAFAFFLLIGSLNFVKEVDETDSDEEE